MQYKEYVKNKNKQNIKKQQTLRLHLAQRCFKKRRVKTGQMSLAHFNGYLAVAHIRRVMAATSPGFLYPQQL